MPQLWQIAVNAPLNDYFTYYGEEDLVPGSSVKVPFGRGNRKISGLVIGKAIKEPEKFKAKNIFENNLERPNISKNHIAWLEWMSKYYLYPMGQIQELVFPPLKKESKRKSRKTPIVPDVEKKVAPPLTEEQKTAVDSLELSKFQTYLLHGVTGSGKTEVYIEWIEKAFAAGQTAMVLVPEISLTPQLVRRFAERFPNDVAVIHSHLTPREKTDQWWQAFEKKKRLLIGARSALFCPMPDLGIIVVDEEHESSFKQEEKLKYNARDCAIMKGHLNNIPVVLGSATPSLETWQNVLNGKFKKITMAHRVSHRPLPAVEIINMALHRDKPDFLPHWLSPVLYEQLKSNYDKNLQSALFLNRRGVAPSVQCYSCGFIYMCPNCDISLTLHGRDHMVCHYCDFHERLALSCPECKDGEPKAYGLGTEAIETDIQTLFPNSRVFRADRDEIQSREAIEDMVEQMESGKIDFLVGTQMIAKGLDFKNLTLVGLVNADVALNVPDFRASERAFQLCTQVSGRAGRHEVPGQVIIQTYKPDHPSLVASQKNNYNLFAENELAHRKMFCYPPFGKLAAIRLSGLQERQVIEDGQKIVQFIQGLIENFSQLSGAQVLGPTPAPLSRIKNRYRYHILIKSQDHKILNFMGQKIFSFIQEQCKKTKCLIDVDPYSLI